jgi:hypothetical protein
MEGRLWWKCSTNIPGHLLNLWDEIISQLKFKDALIEMMRIVYHGELKQITTQ